MSFVDYPQMGTALYTLTALDVVAVAAFALTGGAAAAVVAIFAARSSALLFVRGAIVGACTLGRGLGLGLAESAVAAGSPAEAVAETIPADVEGRDTEDERRETGGRDVAGCVDAAEAGRERGTRPEGALLEVLEEERDGVWVDGLLKLNEDGGAASFIWRRLALRFVRGGTVGGFVLETGIDSRRLCPGTPSNVALLAVVSFALATVPFGFPFAAGTMLFRGDSADFCPIRNDAARVMRGANTGGAVLATVMVSERLCPGTFANVFARRSLVGGARSAFSTGRPARRADARDMRGTIVGVAIVAGTGRALNSDLPFGVLSPAREGLVTEEPLPLPLDVVLRSADSTDDETERSEPAGKLSPTSGSSVVGNGGDDAKMAEIWISAVGPSGEPITAFCMAEIP